jgi:hypothetical protein
LRPEAAGRGSLDVLTDALATNRVRNRDTADEIRDSLEEAAKVFAKRSGSNNKGQRNQRSQQTVFNRGHALFVLKNRTMFFIFTPLQNDPFQSVPEQSVK